MEFFIKQYSTVPILTIKISEKIIDEYNLEYDDFDNVAVTFSMVDSDNQYEIANVPADLKVEERVISFDNDYNYFLQYKFSKDETNKAGIFIGEFKIDFLDNPKCGKLTLPDERLYIYIQPSITKTTVIKY